MVSENNISPSSKRDEKGVKKQQMNPEIYLSEDLNKIEAVSHIPTKKNSGIGFKSYSNIYAHSQYPIQMAC